MIVILGSDEEDASAKRPPNGGHAHFVMGISN